MQYITSITLLGQIEKISCGFPCLLGQIENISMWFSLSREHFHVVFLDLNHVGPLSNFLLVFKNN